MSVRSGRRGRRPAHVQEADKLAKMRQDLPQLAEEEAALATTIQKAEAEVAEMYEVRAAAPPPRRPAALSFRRRPPHAPPRRRGPPPLVRRSPALLA